MIIPPVSNQNNEKIFCPAPCYSKGNHTDTCFVVLPFAGGIAEERGKNKQKVQKCVYRLEKA